MKDFMRQAEICKRLGIHVTTWIRWRKTGQVEEPAKVPGVNKWPVDYIEALAKGEQRPQGRRYFGAHRATAIK